MGLFNRYLKEGPGVDPDAPVRGAAAVFFGIVGRKFWKLIQINLLYVLFNIPALVVSFFLTSYLIPTLFPNMTIERLNALWDPAMMGEGTTPETMTSMLIISMAVLMMALLVGLSYVTVGPVQAGLTMVLRNYSRETHAFIWADARDAARDNLRQSSFVSLLTLALSIVLPVALSFYSQMVTNDLLRMILLVVIFLAALLFTMMLPYVYQQLITFDLTLSQIYRNALIMTMAKLPHNFGILLACVFILAGIPLLLMYALGTLGVVISILYWALFAFAFSYLLQHFMVNRQLQRYMIQPILDKEAAEEQAAILGDQASEPEEQDADEEEAQVYEPEPEEAADEGARHEGPAVKGGAPA